VSFLITVSNQNPKNENKRNPNGTESRSKNRNEETKKRMSLLGRIHQESRFERR